MKPGLSQTIRQLRKAKGLTQRALAKVLGISLKSVSNYENELREPDSLTYYKLSLISPNEDLATYFFEASGLSTEDLAKILGDELGQTFAGGRGLEYLRSYSDVRAAMSPDRARDADLILDAFMENEATEGHIAGAKLVGIVMKTQADLGAHDGSWFQFGVKLSPEQMELMEKLFRLLRYGTRKQTNQAIKSHIRDAFECAVELGMKEMLGPAAFKGLKKYSQKKK